MSFFSKIIAFFIAGVLLSSCFDDPDCISLKNNLMGISFRKMFDGQPDTVGVIGVKVSGTDSIFSELVFTTGVSLPLNPGASQADILLSLLTGDQTLSMSYRVTPQCESPDCGPRFIFSDLSLTGHSFDSLRTISTTPGEEAGVTNFTVYRCPYTENVKIAFRQLLADDQANGQLLEEDLHGISLDYSSFLFWVDTLVSSVVLPLNVNAPATNITFDFKRHGLVDLNLGYTQSQQTLFAACGAQTFIHDLSVLSSEYEITRIVKDSISDPPQTNILLLRCPDTNLIKMDLKATLTGAAAPFQLSKVTAGHTLEEFYVDSLTSSLVLPLDENLDQTDFTIEFESTTKIISIGYSRAFETYHDQCNQTLFYNLQVLSSDFTTTPVLKNDSIQFPVVTNVEVINN